MYDFIFQLNNYAIIEIDLEIIVTYHSIVIAVSTYLACLTLLLHRMFSGSEFLQVYFII